MKEMFVGREKELKRLASAYDSGQCEFLPIYGQRRVGKSELILHFTESLPSLYFLGKQSTSQPLLKEFMATVARSFGQDWLSTVNVDNWKSALDIAVAQKPADRKLVIALDEFQWLVESSPELPSILQEMLDIEWKNRSDVMLIVCGSYMGFMERDILGEKSPLFGRRTGQILLKPFEFDEARLFHPNWSLNDNAKAYFICGGVPMYLKFFKEKVSITGNIVENFLDEYSALHREPDFLLKEELREVQKYYSILRSIATGAVSNAEIARRTGIDERKLYYYIQHLVELGYVERIYPLTAAKPKQRSVRFILSDPLLLFWFRFIYPNLTYITRSGPEKAFYNIIKPDLPAYFGTRFENLCREQLPEIYQREGLLCPYEIGRYWDKNVQIDLVGQRRDGNIDLGECKWGSVKSTAKLAEELQSKIRFYPNPQNETVNARIFTRSKINNASDYPGFRFHSLEDLI